MHWFRGLLAVGATLAIVGCGDDDEPAGPATSFRAELSGDDEVPPVITDATGTATIDISGAQITYTVEVNSLENPVVAHIHVAAVGANGPVRLDLCGTTLVPPCVSGDGVLISGSNGTTVGTPAISFDELVAAIRAGGAYVNVHTDDGVDPDNTGAGDMASGEIRGQLVPD